MQKRYTPKSGTGRRDTTRRESPEETKSGRKEIR